MGGSVPSTLIQELGPFWRATLKGTAAGMVLVASHKAEEGCSKNLPSGLKD